MSEINETLENSAHESLCFGDGPIRGDPRKVDGTTPRRTGSVTVCFPYLAEIVGGF